MKDINNLIKNSKRDNHDMNLHFLREESYSRVFLYYFDALIVSLLYLFFGLGYSSFINKYICKTLDKEDSKLNIFFESTGESLLIIIGIFILLFAIPKIPSIVPFPDKNHVKFRHMAEHVVLAFAIIFGHEKLFKKYTYLLN